MRAPSQADFWRFQICTDYCIWLSKAIVFHETKGQKVGPTKLAINTTFPKHSKLFYVMRKLSCTYGAPGNAPKKANIKCSSAKEKYFLFIAFLWEIE